MALDFEDSYSAPYGGSDDLGPESALFEYAMIGPRRGAVINQNRATSVFHHGCYVFECEKARPAPTV